MQGVCEHDWVWSNNAARYFCSKCNDWSYLGNHKNFQVATESSPMPEEVIMQGVEIESCKRCGSSSIDKNRYPECFYAACDECGYSVSGSTQEEVIKKWNRRVRKCKA